MKFYELVNKSGLSISEVAHILGTSYNAISKRVINTTSEAKVSELYQIENAIGKQLYFNTDIAAVTNSCCTDKVFIPYLQIHGVDDNIFRHARVKDGLQFDKELVQNDWGRNPADLRLTKMLGVKMESGDYVLKNNDLLIVDTSSRSALSPGVYICSFQDEVVFISGVAPTDQNGIKLYYYDKKFDDKIYSPEQLKELNFKIHGRIIKNMSLTI